MKEPPKQHNQWDLSLGCLEATCQAQSTLITQLVIAIAGLCTMCKEYPTEYKDSVLEEICYA